MTIQVQGTNSGPLGVYDHHRDNVMHSMLWSWSLFARSMKKLTANFFPPRVKGLGMTWRNTQERSTFSCLKLSSSSYRHDNLYTPGCSKSRIILIVFIMSTACVLSVDRYMKHVCALILVSCDALIVFRSSLGGWRRTESNIGGVRSAWGRGWRAQPDFH